MWGLVRRFLALKHSEEALGQSCGGALQDFQASNSFRNASPGIKFRRICLISCCGGRGVRESAFLLAWLAEELIHRNKFIIL